jgi:hypothetical protein
MTLLTLPFEMNMTAFEKTVSSEEFQANGASNISLVFEKIVHSRGLL